MNNFILCIFVIIICLIFYKDLFVIENFKLNNINNIIVIDYDKFNKMFDTDIVTLPFNIIASGYNNGNWYIIKHKNNTDIQKNTKVFLFSIFLFAFSFCAFKAALFIFF